MRPFFAGLCIQKSMSNSDCWWVRSQRTKQRGPYSFPGHSGMSIDSTLWDWVVLSFDFFYFTHSNYPIDSFLTLFLANTPQLKEVLRFISNFSRCYHFARAIGLKAKRWTWQSSGNISWRFSWTASQIRLSSGGLYRHDRTHFYIDALFWRMIVASSNRNAKQSWTSSASHRFQWKRQWNG